MGKGIVRYIGEAMSGKKSRNKGYRYENELVHKFQDAGVVCNRVPLSGMCVGYKDDLNVMDKYPIEVKRRKSINNMFYEVLSKCKYGITRADNKGDIVFMTLDTFIDMIKEIG